MFKILVTFFCMLQLAFATSNQDLLWPEGESFLGYISKFGISKDLYFNLSKTDQELCSEIEAGMEYREILSDKGALLHALLPINEEMQIHIYQSEKKAEYKLDIIPVIYEAKTEILKFQLESSPYQDIVRLTNNKLLANEFVRAFQKSVNFRKVHKGDLVAIKYHQKTRLGKYWGSPEIYGAFVKLKHQDDKYIFQNDNDGNYYDDLGKSLTSIMFKTPIPGSRISSSFTLKRFHPVLKIYRAHLGTDFAAKKGTKIGATGNGKIVFMGQKGGYGNCVIINHDNGFKSLYGHLSGFNKKLRGGAKVAQGETIGYVGSTGLSSGPHLHFGMYKQGKAMDPMKVLTLTKQALSGKVRNAFMANVKKIKSELEATVVNGGSVFKLPKMEISSQLHKTKSI